VDTHKKTNGLLVALALGELDPTQSSEVKAHLQGCRQCADELKRLERLLECTSALRVLSADESTCASARQSLLETIACHEARRSAAGRTGLVRRLIVGVGAIKPAYRLVAAAVVVATVVAVVGWLAPGRARPGLLFADVLEKVRAVRSVKFTSTVTMEGGPSTTYEVLRLEPGRSRMTDARTGMVTIIDKVGGRQLLLIPEAKKAILTVFEGPAEPARDQPVTLLDKITRLRKGAGQKLGRRVIGGRTVSGFRGRLEGGEWVVWADPQTGLPVRMEATSSLMVPGFRMAMTDFEWDIGLDESLFSLTPPEGYQVQEKHVPASAPLAEGDLVEGLKFWAERMDSAFPPAFVGLLMTKALAEKLQGEFKRQYEEETLKEAPSKDPEKMRSISEKVYERVYGQAQTKVMRMVGFAGDQDGWRYVARGVKLGEAGKPVCWWRPKGSDTYRVLFGDLSVRDMTHAALPPVAQAKEPFEWLPTREDVDMAGCRRNLKQIGTALLMYAKANDHKFPGALDELVPFLEDRGHLTCPASKGGEAAYIYAKPAERLTQIQRPSDVMLVFDRYHNHTFGRNVLFADGRVAWLAEEDFKQSWVEQQKVFNLAGLSELGDVDVLKKVCQGHLNHIGIAIFMYLQAHDHQYPNSLDDLVTYLEGRRPLLCPGSGEEGYIYEKPAAPFLKVVEPRSVMTVYDKPGNHEGGRNVLFLDGHVQWLTEDEFQKLWAEQQAHPAPEHSPHAQEGQTPSTANTTVAQ
jgi:prepilin-type processing-associated H-X9-DG protein